MLLVEWAPKPYLITILPLHYCTALFGLVLRGLLFFLVGRCLIHKDPRLRAAGSKASDFGRLSLHPKNPNRGMLRTLVGQIFAL